MADKKIKKERYISQDGFVETEIYRGKSELKKLSKWLEHYLGLGDKFCFCGGYVRWMCSPHMNPVLPGDLDIYSTDKKTFDIIAAEFDRFWNLEIRAENDMAITYKQVEHGHGLFPLPAIQLITPMEEGKVVTEGDMAVILENFDFTIIRCGITAKMLRHDKAMVDADFAHDEPHKLIRIKNIHCPISSVYRCIKYSKKGYWLQSSQTLKIFNDWMERSDKYRGKINELMERDSLTEEEVWELERMMRITD